MIGTRGFQTLSLPTLCVVVTEDGDGARFFSKVPCERKRGGGNKLQQGNWVWGQLFCTASVAEHWSGLPKEAVVFPSLEVLKTVVDKVLSSQT